MSFEVLLKNRGQVLTRLRIRFPVKARVSPRCFIALYDEGAGRVIELIRMRDKQPGFVLAKGQCQAVKQLSSPQPNVLVLTKVDGRLESSAEHPSHKAVSAIRSHQQIAGGHVVQVGDIRVEAQIDTQFLA